MLEYITPPLAGAIIGWGTNWLAIKMIFRPLYPKHVFGVRLPFTPGLIPKERARIAESIGQAGESLIDLPSIQEKLLSEQFTEKIAGAVDGFIDRQRRNDEPVRSFIAHWISEDVVNDVVANGKRDVAAKLAEAIRREDFTDTISDKIVQATGEKIKDAGILPGIGFLGKIGGIEDKIMASLKSNAKKVVAKQLRGIVENHSEKIIYDISGKGIDAVLETPVSKLVEQQSENIGQLRGYLMEAYRVGVAHYLPRILPAINIRQIMVNSVMGLDLPELERMLLKVVNKELKAIVWLGALLGFLIGALTMLV